MKDRGQIKRRVTNRIYKLSKRELERITNGERLTDIHITTASQLLQQQFPNVGGLYSPSLAYDLSFDPVNGSFIQILHTGTNHWVTVEGVDDSLVRVYDSLYTSTTTSTRMSVAALAETSKHQITVQIAATQFQKGGTDCGVYAIAYATDLCHGNNPASYRYNQDKMREHLLQCFKERKLTPFPSVCIRGPKPINTEKIDVFCTCRLPHMVDEPMAFCPCCREWYHSTCEDIPKYIFTNKNAKWKCSRC